MTCHRLHRMPLTRLAIQKVGPAPLSAAPAELQEVQMLERMVFILRLFFPGYCKR